MAVFRLSVTLIKRSTGQSVTAAAAYRSGTRIKCDRLGKVHNYQRKTGIVEAVIFAPKVELDWMKDRERLWNSVEAIEKRKDAQLAREVLVSLPHELDDAQRKQLLAEFVTKHFVVAGMIADVAIHTPSKRGDERNHHAHILLTLRRVSESGLGKKERSWNSREMLEIWRKSWAEMQNRHLAMANVQQCVDHRSLKERYREAILNDDQELAFKFDRPPEPKLGVEVCAVEEKAKKRFERLGQQYLPSTRLFREVMVIRRCTHVISRGQNLVKQKEKEIEFLRRNLQVPEENEHIVPKVNSIPVCGKRPQPAASSEFAFDEEPDELDFLNDLANPSP